MIKKIKKKPFQTSLLVLAILSLMLWFHKPTDQNPTLPSINVALNENENSKEDAHQSIDIPQANETNSSPKPQAPSVVQKPTEQKAVATKKTVSLSVNVKTLLNNQENFNSNKLSLIPSSGFVFQQNEIEMNEGESVFDVLQKTLRDHKIHFEFVFNPLYNSAYIKGIQNIYEFDCGPLSGWMYRVNGAFPSYGVSQYMVKEDDYIEILYTCDLGEDIGGQNAYGS